MLLTVVGCGGCGALTAPPEPRVLASASATGAPRARLEDAAFLEGRWSGAGWGGACDLVWLGPRAGALAGLFRLVKGNGVVEYELSTIAEAEGSLVLRVKHFGADLTGAEPREAHRAFPLARKAPGTLWFEGVTLHDAGGGRLEIHVLVEEPGGSERVECLSLTRARD